MDKFPEAMRQQKNVGRAPFEDLDSIGGSAITGRSHGSHSYTLTLADGRTAEYALTSDESGLYWTLNEQGHAGS